MTDKPSALPHNGKPTSRTVSSYDGGVAAVGGVRSSSVPPRAQCFSRFRYSSCSMRRAAATAASLLPLRTLSSYKSIPLHHRQRCTYLPTYHTSVGEASVVPVIRANVTAHIGRGWITGGTIEKANLMVVDVQGQGKAFRGQNKPGAPIDSHD